MADILQEIQQRQIRAREQQIVAKQDDLDWSTTFGKMAPEEVLRETRNMTELMNSAVEKKMQLAAQTNEAAQRIYINDQKWKAEQAMQPLKDERIKAQVRADEARAKATTAQELLATARLEREARSVEQTALAQWEMDEIENAATPEAERRAWINSVRGKYPSMDKDAVARFDGLHGRFNPKPLKPEDTGTISIDEDGKRRISRPLKPGEEEQAGLLKRHAELEAAISNRSAEEKEQDPAVISEINALKKKLGFAPIGGATSPAQAPAAAPQNKAALDWIAANPNDPRAAAIKAKLGIK